jgi:hypothetical protein
MKARVLANPFRIELRSDVAYGLPTKWTQCLYLVNAEPSMCGFQVSDFATHQDLARWRRSIACASVRS